MAFVPLIDPVYNTPAEDPGEAIPAPRLESEEAKWRRGSRAVQVPFLLVPGSVQAPGLGFQGDERTGFFRKALGQLGVALFGIEFFAFLPGGLQLRGLGPYSTTLAVPDLAADRVLALPDASGTLATTANLDARTDFTADSAEATEDILAGMAVRVDASYGLLRASGSDVPVGVALNDAGPGEAVLVRVAGLVTLADWTGAVGATTLAAGAEWYLGTDGALTTTAGTAHVLSRVNATTARIR